MTDFTSDFARLRDIIFRISCFMSLRNIAIDSSLEDSVLLHLYSLSCCVKLVDTAI